MADANIMNKSARAVIQVVALVLCSVLIAWLVAYGDPKNSLHTSAMGWAFTVFLGVLLSEGIIAVVDRWVVK